MPVATCNPRQEATTCLEIPPAQRFLNDVVAARVERAIRSRTGGRLRDLHVVVDNEVVTLSGRTSTYYAKQLALHAALMEVGERKLSNDIEVE